MTTKPKEKSIIFGGPMVRAILDGRKTQTRRVITGVDSRWDLARFESGVLHRVGLQDCPDDIVCPYEPGMRLWVRETWQETDETQNETPGVVYKATDPDWESMDGWRWRSPIHMPRSASRIILEVTNRWAERVQGISAKDIIAEGAVAGSHQPNWDDRDWPVSAFDGACYLTLLSLWHSGWDSINAKRGFGWKENPWVWVIEFRRIKP